MNQENHPKDVRLNHKGANRDVDKEILGANSQSGEYIDGRNLRVSSNKSERNAAEKILGEVLVHSNNDAGDYESILSSSVNGQKIEFWCDVNDANDPIITIDGVIVAKSEKIPFSIKYPLQHDVNNSCIGGEIFVTDNNVPPMIFNIQDMIDSLVTNPNKYFIDFNASLYAVNLNAPLSIPVFKELVNVGGSNGLAPGSYVYSFRYVTADGDRTDWTPPTPAIPVLDNVSSSGAIFPGVRTFGAEANAGSKTNYGIKIKFRVNNVTNFDFIEIRRQDYTLGLSNILTPDSVIVAKIDLVDGEISVKEFIDPLGSNVFDAISEEDEVSKLALIDRAKAIRYHDKKVVLMNVGFNERNAENIVFKDINGENGIPILKNMGKLGHKDPYNHVYNRKYIGGEKFGFGISVHGSLGGSSFVQKVPGLENFQFPNRRDPVSADSQTYSYEGTPTAATVSGGVDKVFEVFDLENAVNKTEKCTFKNIMKEGSKSRAVVNSLGCSDGGFGSDVPAEEVQYNPFHPTAHNDSDLSGHNYQTNVAVDSGGGIQPYNPLAHAPDYYSMGVAIGGVENLPTWAKAFSVVRTEAAGRVVAQGIGMYSLKEGSIEDISGPFDGEQSISSTTKDRNKMWFHSADATGLTSQAVSDIQNNPEDYRVQLVSPLGFFSEIYAFNNVGDGIGEDHDGIIDMISYARILHDEGQQNPNETPGMGISSGGKNYVAHNKYRNGEAASGNAFGGDGNKFFTFNGFNERTDGGSSYFEIEFDDNIYNTESPILLSGDFDNVDMQQWHEPFYIINIINVGAEIKDLNIDNYKATGAFQKVESIIGFGNGTPNQSFELVDERWEDCIPDTSASGPFASLNAYIYLVDKDGNSQTWMNVTYRSAAQKTVIINDIINNGFHSPAPGINIVGLYTHTSSNNNRDFNIVFDVPSFYPTSERFVTIKYDSSRPIRVFGGDSVVAENVFSPIDRNTSGEFNSDPTNQFVLNVGFPFRNYTPNPRLFVPKQPYSAFPAFPVRNPIEQDLNCQVSRVRQMLVMFAGESRAAVNFAHNTTEVPEQQYFPLINYVMRPSSGVDAIISMFGDEYVEDYGIGEISPTRLTSGGFRFIQQVNADYSYDGPIGFFTKPDFGFEVKTNFCTAVIWSLSRAVNVQDSPGLKTFINTNRLDISDDQGEIKKAYDATTGGKGENLYAITKSGICLLLTKKSILTSIDADDLSTVASDQFISSEYWLSKTIGSDDEMWRGMGEGTIGFVTETGNVEKEALFFPNKESVFSLVENQIKDIGRNNYYSRLNPFLKGLKPGYEGKLSGVINKNNNEYWLDIEGAEGSRDLFSYGNEGFSWEGSFDYRFDKYFMAGEKMYGSRDLKTFELDEGFVINGGKIPFELTTAFAPGNVALEKEFIRIGIQTAGRGKMKPTRVEFYDDEETLLCSLDTAAQGGLFLKQYDGWEQFIGRKDVGASATRDRVQGRVLVVKIIHDLPEDFKIVTTTIQYKIIK